MFGFAAPRQRRLDGLDQWGAQSQAQTQQQLAATDAQLGQAQQQPAPQAAPVGGATPGATPGAAPAPAPTPLQNAASQAYHWITNQFGGGGGAAAPAADPYAAVNVQPGLSGQHPIHAYLASRFGG